MIVVRTEDEINKLREAGKVVGLCHKYLQQFIRPGISTKELDILAKKFIESKGCTCSFEGLYGFPGSICISINDEVVHGIPGHRTLKNGDIVKLDIGACYEGYHGDSAWSYPVGSISSKKQYLLEHTEKALFKGLSEIKPGARIGDISNAIETYANSHKLGVVRELVGHGIGSHLHEDPEVPNYGAKGTGITLKKGMTIAVEPMLNLGTRKVYLLDDDWTIVTGDNKPSAHFEHTIVVTDDGYEILTGDDNYE